MPRDHHPLRPSTLAHILEIATDLRPHTVPDPNGALYRPSSTAPLHPRGHPSVIAERPRTRLDRLHAETSALSTTYTDIAAPIRRVDCHPPPDPYHLPRPRERGQYAAPETVPEFDASATPASPDHLSRTRPAPPQTPHTSGVSRPCGPFGIPSQYDDNGPRNPHPLHSDSSLLGRHCPISSRSSDPAAHPWQSHGRSTQPGYT